jgi:hypothetical protein
MTVEFTYRTTATGANKKKTWTRNCADIDPSPSPFE